MELLLESLTEKVIFCALEVHKNLGPGLLESIYQKCLLHELLEQDFNVQSEVVLPVQYKSLYFEDVLRLDLLVEDKIILEIKAVRELTNLHRSQLYTYLKLSNKKVGLLMNFNTQFLREGIKRVINTNSSLPQLLREK